MNQIICRLTSALAGLIISIHGYASFLPIPSRRHIGSTNGDIRLSINQICLHDHLLWLGMVATNHSAIDFRHASLHFYIKEKKRRLKRAAWQVKELEPVSVTHTVANPSLLPGGSADSINVSFKPFYLSKGKYLQLECWETDGARVLRVKIKARKFAKLKMEENGNPVTNNKSPTPA